MNKIFKGFSVLVLSLVMYGFVFGQNYTVTGKITNSENGEAVYGAIVVLTPGSYGANTNEFGQFKIDNVPAGKYTIKASIVSYEAQTRSITIKEDMSIDFRLKPSSILSKEVIVEVNRAKERETPVAFTDIDAKTIDTRIHGQDAPMLVAGTPGLYTFSTDGVGNGESKMLVRGFSQNYVQVLINGIPTNDPESNAVYWSNWGSVSSSAASIQVQRGAGSSLYGAGAFGGSFNIITMDANPTSYYGGDFTLGDPKNTMYGIKLNSGLIDNKFAFSFNLARKVAEGTRTSGRYVGYNYYLSASYYPEKNQTLKFILYGAPQVHGYSYSSNVAYFKKYGYDANGSPILPTGIASLLPPDKISGKEHYALFDNSREIKDDNYVNLAHNFYHKPQAELHYTYDLSDQTQLNATYFYSIGRGGGSSLTSAATMFSVNSSTGAVSDYYGAGGLIPDLTQATYYLKNAQQRVAYSFHQQTGILANLSTTLTDYLKLTAGAEFRYWKANHPGHFVNLYGKDSVSYTYKYATVANGVTTYSSFTRSVKQGDLDGPESDDLGNIFGWNLAGSKDPTYKTQYRNYDGITPQTTIFAQGNWIFDKLNIMTSIQYVWYEYKLKENMPSDNGVAVLLSEADRIAKGVNAEGQLNGKFYMRDQKGKYYEFSLVDANRSNSFFQPKIGANYNLNDNFNVFGNYAHVQRFVDLSVYYNYGALFPDAQDEKSDQFELGLGYSSPWLSAKVNGYHMLWKNKSSRIQDPSKAGQPGYDYQGYRTDLVGTSRNIGIEFAALAKLDDILPIKGFELTASLTMMNNKWIEVLDKAKYDIYGKRRVYNAYALNSAGKTDTLFFDELKDSHVASGPQTMMMLGLRYNFGDFYVALNMNYFARDYMLDGDAYMAIDGNFYQDANGKSYFNSVYDNKLPSRTLVDIDAGYRFKIGGIIGNASLQLLNIFDKEYFGSSDSYGVIPGMLRTWRFNVNLGL
jgi:outer membrane receptor protein involved in Fe transport